MRDRLVRDRPFRDRFVRDRVFRNRFLEDRPFRNRFLRDRFFDDDFFDDAFLIFGELLVFAEYDTAAQQLRVDVISADPRETFTVFVTATGETIGTLDRRIGVRSTGEFDLLVAPRQIDVDSSLGGFVTEAVVLVN